MTILKNNPSIYAWGEKKERERGDNAEFTVFKFAFLFSGEKKGTLKVEQ